MASLLSDVNIWILGSKSVSEQLRTYPSPHPNLTPTVISWLLLGQGRGSCEVAQKLILTHSPRQFPQKVCYIRFLFALHF